MDTFLEGAYSNTILVNWLKNDGISVRNDLGESPNPCIFNK